ncbi:MAG: hypothetical protein WBG66_10080 [Geitlerinemataceae cyanobacterium]
MNYIRYIKSILVGFITGFFVFLIVFLFQVGSPTQIRGDAAWINFLYTTKSQIARSISTPKLFVVSGSNSLFGISCKTIHDRLDIGCVNFGTHAGISVDYMLYRTKAVAQPGDTVILPLEYSLYTENGTPSDVFIDYVVSRDPKYLLSLNPVLESKFVFGMSFERLKTGILSKFNPQPDRFYIETPYHPDRINQYGDQTYNTVANIAEKQANAVAEIQPMTEMVYYIQSSYGMTQIQEFVTWCRQHNIQVLATWPNTVWFDFYQGKTKTEYWQSIKDFYHRIQVPILGEPEDFLYDKSLFFDTLYHLNDRGVNKRTQQLIELLKPYLVN